MPKLTRDPHAVIDIGSNSVRMVLFDGVKRTPVSFFNEKVLCGLGKGLDETGHLPVQGAERALKALKRFQIISERHELTSNDISCIATSAVRDASNRQEFIDAAEAIMGVKLQILSGEEEALLAAHGVMAGDPGFTGWVADLGGGSLELAEVVEGKIQRPVSFPFGALRLGQRPTSEISPILAKTFAEYATTRQSGRLYVVGGAWRALGRVHMNRCNYPLKVLHHYDIRAAEAARFSLQIKSSSDKAVKKISEIVSPARARTVPYAGHVLCELIEALRPTNVTFSSHGIREGLIHSMLPQQSQAMDPVADGIGMLERRYQLDPERSREVYLFSRTVFGQYPSPYERLLEPICRLSNMAWRDHPNYRRANILHAVLFSPVDGLSHKERIFMALSLYYRYGGDAAKVASQLGRTLDAGDVQFAKTIGAYLRFVHTLTGRVTGVLTKCALTTQGSRLTFRLAHEFEALRGEAVETRLQNLAQLMGLEAETVIS